MLYRTLIFILFLWCSGNILGQSASVHAIAPDYAGKSVQTSIARNPFINVAEYSFTLVCNEKGEIEQLIPLESKQPDCCR